MLDLVSRDLAEFEKELARQTLISERSRCSLLAGALGLLLGVMIVYSVALAGTPGALPGMTGVMIVVAFAALFEFGTSLLLTHLLRTGRTRPPFAPYLSTFIEMALPTCAMLIIAHADTPHSAINSAAPYGYVLYIILSALRLEFRPCLFAGALAALGYGALMLAYWPHLEGAWTGSLSLLRLTLLLRVILLFLGGLAAAFVSMRIKTTLLETLRETQERARIVDLFGQHVSPAVVNQLLTQPVGETSEQRDVCILVLDIRNFTTFSEDGDADEVVAYLNCLWSSTVEAVNDHGGIVNKFLGDGFLAVFGAPLSQENDCRNAIAAARRIVSEVERLAAEGQIPPTRVGIALHAGRAVVGNIGSRDRKEYTVIGDVVNVAFRIEALNKELGSTILLSEPVHTAAGLDGTGLDRAEKIAPIPIRGRREPVQLYRLI
jgi:adenylate cyclase